MEKYVNLQGYVIEHWKLSHISKQFDIYPLKGTSTSSPKIHMGDSIITLVLKHLDPMKPIDETIMQHPGFVMIAPL